MMMKIPCSWSRRSRWVRAVFFERSYLGELLLKKFYAVLRSWHMLAHKRNTATLRHTLNNTLRHTLSIIKHCIQQCISRHGHWRILYHLSRSLARFARHSKTSLIGFWRFSVDSRRLAGVKAAVHAIHAIHAADDLHQWARPSQEQVVKLQDQLSGREEERQKVLKREVEAIVGWPKASHIKLRETGQNN